MPIIVINISSILKKKIEALKAKEQALWILQLYKLQVSSFK